MNRYACFALGLTIVALLALHGCTGKESVEPTITVTGMAEIYVPPDYLTARLSVKTLDMDPVKAKKENNERIRSILSFLENLDIESKDIATGHVGLNKSYKIGRYDEQIFEGYEAVTSIQVTVRDLQLFDQFIDGSLELGLNSIWGISFKSTDIVEKHPEARKSAIRAAKEKAEYLAAEIGQSIGSAVNITSGSTTQLTGRYGVTSNDIRYIPGNGGFSESNTQTIMPDSIRVWEEVQVEFKLMEGI